MILARWKWVYVMTMQVRRGSKKNDEGKQTRFNALQSKLMVQKRTYDLVSQKMIFVINLKP